MYTILYMVLIRANLVLCPRRPMDYNCIHSLILDSCVLVWIWQQGFQTFSVPIDMTSYFARCYNVKKNFFPCPVYTVYSHLQSTVYCLKHECFYSLQRTIVHKAGTARSTQYSMTLYSSTSVYIVLYVRNESTLLRS